MATVAFVGLGVMGAPMAGHLLQAGHDLVGLASSPSVATLVARGGRRAHSIAEAMSGADVVITMVPDSAAVESVALGASGIYAHAAAGTLHIDCSSIRPDVARSLARAGAEYGVAVLDAPVSGGESGAREASLAIMVGGDSDAVDRAMPFLTALGTTVVHVGPSGAGQTVKAANQLIVGGILQLVAEALVFLEAHGVDPSLAVSVLREGLAGSTVLDRKSAGMIAREFTPGARIDLHHKDMGTVLAAARDAGVAIPLGAHVADLIASLRTLGHGSLDHSALLVQVERLSGRSEPRDR